MFANSEKMELLKAHLEATDFTIEWITFSLLDQIGIILDDSFESRFLG